METMLAEILQDTNSFRLLILLASTFMASFVMIGIGVVRLRRMYNDDQTKQPSIESTFETAIN